MYQRYQPHGACKGAVFTVRFSGLLVRYTIEAKTHLSKQKERMQ